MPRKQNSY